MHTVDEIIINWFNSEFGTGFSGGVVGNSLLIALSIVLAGAFTGLIGLEREVHGHSAGLRTHLLVAIGSAVVMLVSIYGFRPWDAEFVTNGISRDPSRLAAQVVTGIGFIGAGTIIQTGISVRGLTTATTLWISMAIGLACGSGNFVIGAMATIVAVIALMAMRGVERFAARRNPVLVIVFPSEKPVFKDLLLTAQRYGISLHDQASELVTYQENSAVRMVMRLASGSPSATNAFLEEIRRELKPLEVKIQTEN